MLTDEIIWHLGFALKTGDGVSGKRYEWNKIGHKCLIIATGWCTSTGSLDWDLLSYLFEFFCKKTSGRFLTVRTVLGNLPWRAHTKRVCLAASGCLAGGLVTCGPVRHSRVIPQPPHGRSSPRGERRCPWADGGHILQDTIKWTEVRTQCEFFCGYAGHPGKDRGGQRTLRQGVPGEQALRGSFIPPFPAHLHTLQGVSPFCTFSSACSVTPAETIPQLSSLRDWEAPWQCAGPIYHSASGAWLTASAQWALTDGWMDDWVQGAMLRSPVQMRPEESKWCRRCPEASCKASDFKKRPNIGAQAKKENIKLLLMFTSSEALHCAQWYLIHMLLSFILQLISTFWSTVNAYLTEIFFE